MQFTPTGSTYTAQPAATLPDDSVIAKVLAPLLAPAAAGSVEMRVFELEALCHAACSTVTAQGKALGIHALSNEKIEAVITLVAGQLPQTKRTAYDLTSALLETAFDDPRGTLVIRDEDFRQLQEPALPTHQGNANVLARGLLYEHASAQTRAMLVFNAGYRETVAARGTQSTDRFVKTMTCLYFVLHDVYGVPHDQDLTHLFAGVTDTGIGGQILEVIGQGLPDHLYPPNVTTFDGFLRWMCDHKNFRENKTSVLQRVKLHRYKRIEAVIGSTSPLQQAQNFKMLYQTFSPGHSEGLMDDASALLVLDESIQPLIYAVQALPASADASQRIAAIVRAKKDRDREEKQLRHAVEPSKALAGAAAARPRDPVDILNALRDSSTVQVMAMLSEVEPNNFYASFFAAASRSNAIFYQTFARKHRLPGELSDALRMHEPHLSNYVARALSMVLGLAGTSPLMSGFVPPKALVDAVSRVDVGQLILYSVTDLPPRIQLYKDRGTSTPKMSSTFPEFTVGRLLSSQFICANLLGCLGFDRTGPNSMDDIFTALMHVLSDDNLDPKRRQAKMEAVFQTAAKEADAHVHGIQEGPPLARFDPSLMRAATETRELLEKFRTMRDKVRELEDARFYAREQRERPTKVPKPNPTPRPTPRGNPRALPPSASPTMKELPPGQKQMQVVEHLSNERRLVRLLFDRRTGQTHTLDFNLPLIAADLKVGLHERNWRYALCKGAARNDHFDRSKAGDRAYHEKLDDHIVDKYSQLPFCGRLEQ